jgi:hypothetical protein
MGVLLFGCILFGCITGTLPFGRLGDSIEVSGLRLLVYEALGY